MRNGKHYISSSLRQKWMRNIRLYGLWIATKYIIVCQKLMYTKRQKKGVHFFNFTCFLLFSFRPLTLHTLHMLYVYVKHPAPHDNGTIRISSLASVHTNKKYA